MESKEKCFFHTYINRRVAKIYDLAQVFEVLQLRECPPGLV